jgi:NAD(P)H-nitrite reductase large subunit
LRNCWLDSRCFPNVNFLKDSGIELGKGIKVNRLETNIKDIYAIGDCAEQHEAIDLRRPIEVWYTGRMMGEVLSQTLTGTPTAYQPLVQLG